ncbi:MAG TPA: hypothetical protein VL595_08885 [Pseudonocardia sp.]|jgi:hypothetical protein|nr:hypothetical protein [Pseudonocardia sp.]
MSARRSAAVSIGIAVAAALSGLVATEGVASAAGSFVVTAKQCTDGGGKVVVSYSKPDKRISHVSIIRTCMGGKYNYRPVQG